ncbi:MAG TPA: hypothetical protein VFA18_08710 [Gemmataceae bacterium]|nr:hypothetical protein [Gemmataceae bacterium]
MSAAPLPPMPGASPTRAETALARLVHLGLQLMEPADVLAYLERHPDLAALLAAMHG